MITVNKAYFFIGPETTINITYWQALSNNTLKVYGNGESALNCKDYKLPDYSRIIFMAHGFNPHELLKMSGIDPNINRPSIDNHMIKLCKNDKAYDLTYKILNKIIASKPVNIDLFSCYGGLVTKDINQLPHNSTITTFIPANSIATGHLEYFYLQKSFSWENTDNPMIRFAYHMLYNTNELQFAINTGKGAKVFVSNIFTSSLFTSGNKLSDSNIADWQLNEFERFREFCSEVYLQNGIALSEQLNNFFVAKYSDYIQSIDIVQYKAALLISSIEERKISAMENIIDSGIDINSKLVGSGVSALFSAASAGATEIVEFLLKQSNINVNIQDDIGLTPLYIASQNNRTEVVNLLLSNLNTDPNIDVDPHSNKMGTALDIAVFLNHDSIAKKILASGGFTHEQFWKVAGSNLIKKQIKLFKKDPVKYVLQHNNDTALAIHALNELIKFDDFNKFTPKIAATISCLNGIELDIDQNLIMICGGIEAHNEL